jgi:type IV pilus assembly protein PilB
MKNFDHPISTLYEDLLLEKRLTENIEEFIGDNEALQSDLLDTQIINLSNEILIQAIEKKASAIHIEPLEDSLRIRFRIDDVLHQPFECFPKKISSPIIARFKIMADLFLEQQPFPQLGSIRRIYQGRKVDFLVDTIPNRYGEKIVLQTRDVIRVDLDLEQLIIERQTLQLIREMIHRPFGLVLVTCPAGYGRTTTLYSLLAELNKPDINICATADKFFEYSLPGITQVKDNREKGLNVAQIIQGFMRQDPDVILVDEIRDWKTAKTVIEAAEKCLVLAGLHTSEAPSAIARLDEMGIEPFMVSHFLIGVIAQRLLRRVCSDCAIPYTPTTAELAQFRLSAPIHEITIYKANTRKERLAKKALGNLCPNCYGMGYKGLVGVYQVMPVTSRIKTLINKLVNTERIYEVAEAEGMKSLFDYSLDLVRQKHTTLEEVNRLILNDYYLAKKLIVSRGKCLNF